MTGVGGYIAMMLLATQATASDADRDVAWAMAYTGFVSRFCPAWSQRLDTIPSRVLPSSETWNTLWGEGGALQQPFRRGGLAAQADYRRDPGFCTHPTRSQPARASLLDRMLRYRAQGSRG